MSQRELAMDTNLTAFHSDACKKRLNNLVKWASKTWRLENFESDREKKERQRAESSDAVLRRPANSKSLPTDD